MSRPLVSVCLPTRNRAGYIREALESVLTQTHSDLEVVICDNASTDLTAEVVSSFADPRIRYLRSDHDLGLAPNWIKAVSAATGTYCAIIGDDDRWDPRFLECLLPPLANNPKVDVVFCDHWIIDDAGRILVEDTETCSRTYRRTSLQAGLHLPFVRLELEDQAIPVAAAIVRRERLLASGGLDQRAGLVIDYYLFARLALSGGAAFYQPERLAQVRRHAGAGTTARFREIWPDMQWVCADLYDRLGPRERVGIRKKWAHAIFWQLASLAGGRAWGELPPALAAAFRPIPAWTRIQLGLLTLRAAFSTLFPASLRTLFPRRLRALFPPPLRGRVRAGG